MAAPPQQQLHLLLVQLSSEEELASRLATGGCKGEFPSTSASQR
jgi:hypothetical protein